MAAQENSTLQAPVVRNHRNDGRDEMNLAEFPLGVLSDRTLPGQTTLVFEDRMKDFGRNEWITRRLTIAASEKYGLPTSLDDEVILGLIQLTKAQNFADRKVPFTRYHLREILGWRDEGRSYHRLDTSLRRWLGVTLYYDRAWWDNASETWVDENFHILDQVTIRRRAHGGHEAGTPPALSSFVWNETVFRSFQAGYLKRLDWPLFRSLTLPTAKRMYRFLDKRFYHRDVWEFDLREFAFEHIGLSRSYDTGQVKRKLLPGLRELEGVQFIQPLSHAQRFLRVRRGIWKIVVQRQQQQAATSQQIAEPNPVAQLLIERGVSGHVATDLTAAHGEQEVRWQVAAFDRLIRSGSQRALRNPAGFLVAAIRKRYRLDCESKSATGNDAQSSPIVTSARVSDRASQLVAKHFAWLESLAPVARQTFEEEAIAVARGLARDRYEEAISGGQEALARLYREAMVLSHLRSCRAA